MGSYNPIIPIISRYSREDAKHAKQSVKASQYKVEHELVSIEAVTAKAVGSRPSLEAVRRDTKLYKITPVH